MFLKEGAIERAHSIEKFHSLALSQFTSDSIQIHINGLNYVGMHYFYFNWGGGSELKQCPIVSILN